MNETLIGNVLSLHYFHFMYFCPSSVVWMYLQCKQTFEILCKFKLPTILFIPIFNYFISVIDLKYTQSK